MVARLTYRKHIRYNTKGNKQKIVKTPGGKLVFQQLKNSKDTIVYVAKSGRFALLRVVEASCPVDDHIGLLLV